MKFSKSRFFIILSLIFLVWGGVVARSFYLQVIPNEKLQKLKARQFNKIVTLQPRRGVVLDRHDKELAASVTAYSLFADPKIIKSPRNTARKVGKILRIPWRNIYRKIKNKKRRFVWLRRKLDEKTKLKIDLLKIRGIGFVEESKRIYPNFKMLSQVLGFVGKDGQGLGGIESSYDSFISGKQKKVRVQKDARGRPLLVNGRLFTDHPDGATIRLTVESEAQYFLERELSKTVEEFAAQSALGIIMDVNNFEILAMANVPNFDPNNPFRYSSEHRKNKILTDPIEPGSTLKTFVIAAALKEGLVHPSTKIYCEKGRMKIGGITIRESDKEHDFEWLSVNEILAKSSNVGSAKIGFKLGAEKLRQHLVDFGFGAKTKLGLGGESHGILPRLPWRPIKLATISFGQGIAVTPIQLVSAYSAIANGGVLKQPRIIKEIIDSETGDNIDVLSSQEERRILSEEQARTMMLMLSGVTQQDGTAVSARIKGFPVAGKTGTAQIVDQKKGGYERGAYNSSFAGIVPAHAPRYSIYISVEKPQKHYYGSVVAAPVFSKVASFMMRKTGMAPVLISEQNVLPQKEVLTTQMAIQKFKEEIKSQNLNFETVPSLKGLTVHEVLNQVHKKPVDVKIIGRGKVYKTYPAEGKKIDNKTLKVYFK